jgi:hypothetical protein
MHINNVTPSHQKSAGFFDPAGGGGGAPTGFDVNISKRQ